MAQGLILEFDGIGRDVYETVNRKLGIDVHSPTADWPDGLLFHAGGAKAGGWVVFEVWKTKEAQERFMQDSLGRALREGGITAKPSRIEWLDLAAWAATGR